MIKLPHISRLSAKSTEEGSATVMQSRVNLENITIVLKGPKYPGNVGSVARCARNMGIDRLAVVGAGALSAEEMKLMSTHVAAGLVENIRVGLVE